jgi:hypothetical protein
MQQLPPAANSPIAWSLETLMHEATQDRHLQPFSSWAAGYAQEEPWEVVHGTLEANSSAHLQLWPQIHHQGL